MMQIGNIEENKTTQKDIDESKFVLGTQVMKMGKF